MVANHGLASDYDRDKVMTAKVLEITKHRDADKLKLVKLDYGAAEPKTVVTGATNIVSTATRAFRPITVRFLGTPA